jgi:hypothetical protein
MKFLDNYPNKVDWRLSRILTKIRIVTIFNARKSADPRQALGEEKK